MRKVLPLQTSSPGTLFVEVVDAPGYQRQGGVEEVIQTVQSGLQQCFNETAEIGRQAVEAFLEATKSVRPSSLELSLSLKAAGGMNWIIASGTGEATLMLRVIWKSGVNEPSQTQ